MLWPEKRERDSVLGAKVPGTIDRTTERSDVTIPTGYRARGAAPVAGHLHRWLPWLVGEASDIALGPIPQGHPGRRCSSNLKLRAESDDLGDKAAHVGRIGRVRWSSSSCDLATAAAPARATPSCASASPT